MSTNPDSQAGKDGPASAKSSRAKAVAKAAGATVAALGVVGGLAKLNPVVVIVGLVVIVVGLVVACMMLRKSANVMHLLCVLAMVKNRPLGRILPPELLAWLTREEPPKQHQQSEQERTPVSSLRTQPALSPPKGGSAEKAA